MLTFLCYLKERKKEGGRVAWARRDVTTSWEGEGEVEREGRRGEVGQHNLGTRTQRGSPPSLVCRVAFLFT